MGILLRPGRGLRCIGIGSLAFLWITAAPSASDEGFSRYQVILSRKPFGDAPLPEAEPQPVQPQAESFAKTLRMFSITQSDDGELRVGILDQSNQRTYVLQVGETHPEGMKLVSANYDEEEAVLQKNNENVLMKLKDGESGSTISPQELSARSGTPKPTTPGSFSKRRLKRRQDRLAKARNAAESAPRNVRTIPKYEGEDLRAHLQQYNMEVIRQGLPPLPLELTPAQDDQLVVEGVLPPGPGQEALMLVSPEEYQQATAEALAPANPEPDFGYAPAVPPMDEALQQLGDIPLDQLTAEDLRALDQLGIIPQ